MARPKTSNGIAARAGTSTNTPFPKLPQPALRALANAGFDHLEQLADVPEASLSRLHGFGPNALNTLRDALKEIGLTFATARPTLRLVHTNPCTGKTSVQTEFSPDGKAIYVVWSEDGVMFTVNPADGTRRELGVYGRQFQQHAVSPDGPLLVAVGESGGRLWTLPDGVPRGEVAGVPPSPSTAAFSPDAKVLAINSADSLTLYDVASWRSMNTLEFPSVVRWIGFHAEGRSLAFAGEPPGIPVIVFDLDSARGALRLEGHESVIPSAAWHADGGLFATGGATEGTLRLWDFGQPNPQPRVVSLIALNTTKKLSQNRT